MYHNLLSLNEKLTTDQFTSVINEVGFGLELEMEIPEEYQDFFNDVLEHLDTEKLDSFRAIQFIEYLCKYGFTKEEYPNIHEVFNDYERGGAAKNLEQRVESVRKILNEYGVIKASDYHGSSELKGWRLEYDGSLSRTYGCELITPNPEGKGISYTKTLNDIPIIMNLLSDFGFTMNEKTGLHIHLSYKNKLNADGINNFIARNSNRYTKYALACYLSTREQDGYLKLADVSRTTSKYSQTFIAYIDAEIAEQSSYIYKDYIYIFSALNDELKSTLNDPVNKEILYNLSLPNLALVKSRNAIEYTLLNILGAKYLDSVMKGTHYKAYSAREVTIENRLLGGEEVELILCNKHLLQKALKLALTQAFPLLIEKELDYSEVIRAVEIVSRETIIASLNFFLDELYKAQSKSKSLITKTLEILQRVMHKMFLTDLTNHPENYDTLLKNKVQIVASKADSRDRAVIVKGLSSHDLKYTSKTNRMSFTQAEDIRYKMAK